MADLGNAGEFTIRQLAEKVIDLTGSLSNLVLKPLPKDDPMQRQPDISREPEWLQVWTPQIELAEGLKRTIKYFDELLVGDGL